MDVRILLFWCSLDFEENWTSAEVMTLFFFGGGSSLDFAKNWTQNVFFFHCF